VKPTSTSGHGSAESPRKPSPRSVVTLAHGGGGQLTDELIADLVLPRFGNDALNDLLDAASIDVPGARLALTIDGYVVQPLVFPGGDIGRLAISGTVNDLAVSGATPVGVALSLIIAEGFEKRLLAALLDSAAATAREAGVRIVTGDTKVVGRGQADGVYMVTAGVGVRTARRLHPDQVRAGDRIIINGPIADHGMAVMLARELPHVQSALVSDAAPLNGLITSMLDASPGIVFMRDPTRGGIAGACADLAARSGLHVSLIEEAIPVRRETLHAAEMLGIDPLDVANEGKVIAVVRPDAVDAVLSAMRAHPLARDAVVIGDVESEPDRLCDLRTRLGGRRVIQKPYGEQLSRIC
jgi:hydrogenase expression/formation protein HypE